MILTMESELLNSYQFPSLLVRRNLILPCFVFYLNGLFHRIHTKNPEFCWSCLLLFSFLSFFFYPRVLFLRCDLSDN